MTQELGRVDKRYSCEHDPAGEDSCWKDHGHLITVSLPDEDLPENQQYERQGSKKQGTDDHRRRPFICADTCFLKAKNEKDGERQH